MATDRHRVVGVAKRRLTAFYPVMGTDLPDVATSSTDGCGRRLCENFC